MPLSDIIPAVDSLADSTRMLSIIEIIKESSDIDMVKIINYVARWFMHFMANMAFALIVFFAGRWLLGKALRVLDYACKSRRMDATVYSVVRSLSQVIFYIVLMLIVIQILGVNTTSLVAMLASAGLALGMALSGTLQNFAGGAMILILKPYRVGDYITTQSEAGIVKKIMLFTTVLETFDRHTIFIPNSTMSSSIIDNATYAKTRRVDITVSISYGASVAKAREVIMEIIKADKRILGDDDETLDDDDDYTNMDMTTENQHSYAPMVGVKALADSSVNIAVRAWVRTEDYWSVFFSLNETIYETLPKHDIPFPFPQLDVHIKS